MRDALKHYEELATKACWHRSDIPDAIRAYYASIPPAEGAEKQYPYCPTCGDTIEHGEDYGGYCCTKCRDGHNNDLAAQPQPTAEGAEEILLSHPYLKVMYDDTAGEVCMVEQAIWAIEKFATLHAQRIADKMVRKELEAFLIKRDYPHAMQDESVMTMVKHIVDEYLKTRESHD